MVLEGAWDATDGIVVLSARAVQAQPQALHAVFLEPHQDVARERCGRGRRDGDANPELAGFIDQLIEVFARQRVAPGED